MKKIVLTIVAMFSMTLAMAEGENANNVNSANAYNMDVNITSLSRYLQLSEDQKGFVNDVHNTFSKEMEFAGAADKSERADRVRTAVTRDLMLMKAILNDEQYRKYVRVLNVTMVNRGMDVKF